MGSLSDTLFEPYFAMGVHDNVVIVVWRSPLEPEAISELDKRLKIAAKKTPEGIGMVSLAKSAHGVVAGLKRLNPGLGRHTPSLRAVGQAIEGEGMGIGLTRFFATLGLSAPRPRGTAYRITHVSSEAALFVAQKLAKAGIDAPPASALSFSVEHLRQKLAP